MSTRKWEFPIDSARPSHIELSLEARIYGLEQALHMMTCQLQGAMPVLGLNGVTATMQAIQKEGTLPRKEAYIKGYGPRFTHLFNQTTSVAERIKLLESLPKDIGGWKDFSWLFSEWRKFHYLGQFRDFLPFGASKEYRAWLDSVTADPDIRTFASYEDVITAFLAEDVADEKTGLMNIDYNKMFTFYIEQHGSDKTLCTMVPSAASQGYILFRHDVANHLGKHRYERVHATNLFYWSFYEQCWLDLSAGYASEEQQVAAARQLSVRIGNPAAHQLEEKEILGVFSQTGTVVAEQHLPVVMEFLRSKRAEGYFISAIIEVEGCPPLKISAPAYTSYNWEFVFAWPTDGSECPGCSFSIGYLSTEKYGEFRVISGPDFHAIPWREWPRIVKVLKTFSSTKTVKISYFTDTGTEVFPSTVPVAE